MKKQKGGNEIDEEYEDDFEPEYNEVQLDQLTRIIKFARKSEDTQQISSCKDLRTLMQHEFGICYYVSLIHSMFFSRGMRRYVGQQIKYLESKLIAADEYEDYKWYFIMLWNMIDRPKFYKNFDWTYDLCYNLGTSLVASCKLMEDVGETFEYNNAHQDKSGLVFTLGYNYFITKRTSLENAGQGGFVGETLKPVLCSLEMNNVLFITVENYDYTKQQALADHLSKVLKRYREHKIKIDIIALKVPSVSQNLEEIYEKPYKVADELSLDGSLYKLDSAQFQNIPDESGGGHVIAGITCPYANNNTYPRLVLNSWSKHDTIETDWNNSHIVIHGNDMIPYKTYRDAVEAYNDNKYETNAQQISRQEAHNMVFSANQSDCLYFFTREETSEMDKIDIDRVRENVLTKASMLFGEKPKQVFPNGDVEDAKNYYLDLIFSADDGARVKQNLQNVGLTNDFYKITNDLKSFFAISVNYNKFVQLCQDKLGIIEDILVMTGKVPVDIVIEDVKETRGGGVQGLPVPPAPPSFGRRIPNSNKKPPNSSILDGMRQPTIDTKTRYVYFGVKGEILQSAIDRYKQEKFNIEKVDTTTGFIPVRKGQENIEKRLKPGLVYYKFDYNKYIFLFVTVGFEQLGFQKSPEAKSIIGGAKKPKVIKKKKQTK
jgi:hypothetical protein